MDGVPEVKDSNLAADPAPSFRWVSVAHGWISFELCGGSGQYRCTASDANDVPVVLMGGVDDMICGASSCTFSFDLEPAELRWTFSRDGARVAAIIAVFSEWGCAVGGTTRWRGSWKNARDLGQCILGATSAFLHTIGEDEFRRGWPSYDPPMGAIADLGRHVELDGSRLGYGDSRQNQ